MTIHFPSSQTSEKCYVSYRSYSLTRSVILYVSSHIFRLCETAIHTLYVKNQTPNIPYVINKKRHICVINLRLHTPDVINQKPNIPYVYKPNATQTKRYKPNTTYTLLYKSEITYYIVIYKPETIYIVLYKREITHIYRTLWTKTTHTVIYKPETKHTLRHYKPDTTHEYRTFLLPIAMAMVSMAMGIRNVLASSGVARNIISVGHVYWHDVSCWCTLVPRLCRYTTGTIHRDVCSHIYYVAFGVDCSYVVKHIRTKTVSIGIYTLCIVCRN